MVKILKNTEDSRKGIRGTKKKTRKRWKQSENNKTIDNIPILIIMLNIYIL